MAAFRFFKRSRPLVAGENPFRGFWFWLFVAGSLAMVAVGVRGIVAEIQAGRWPSVPCEIMESRVTREMRYGEHRYVPWLRYRYIVSGRVYMSERIHLEPELTYDTFTSAEARLAAFPAGMKTICHVNPANPTQAVLQSKPDYVLLCISPFLLVIWALHERVALADWWGERRRRKVGQLANDKSLAPGALNRKQILAGALALTMGLGFGVMLWGWPWWQQQQSADWQPTHCRIVHNGIGSATEHQGGQSFHTEMDYVYVYGGRQYHGSRITFADDFHLHYSDLEELVKQYRVGDEAACLVNPRNPREAVLRRDFRPDIFFSIFSAALAVTGAVLLGGEFWKKCFAENSTMPWETRRGRALARANRVELRPAVQDGFRSLFAVLGIAGCLVAGIWLLNKSGRDLIRGKIELIPLLYGAAAIIGAGYCARLFWRHGEAAVTAFPTLTLTPALLQLGKPFSVEWKVRRRAPFRLLLEGVQENVVLSLIETPYGASRTEKRQEYILFQQTLVPECSSPDRVGQCRGEIPQDVMHSFESAKRRVLWRIRAEVQTRNGKWISRAYPVLAKPAGPM